MADVLEIVHGFPEENAVQLVHPGRNVVAVLVHPARHRNKVSQQQPGISDQQQPQQHQRQDPAVKKEHRFDFFTHFHLRFPWFHSSSSLTIAPVLPLFQRKFIVFNAFFLKKSGK
ncbi:hypothetical protein SDC9_158008 [bioreactor metagenome]|uniref:Uncharacterized protein n=1 Tax=bioreactor metagenome TaxID=1076179 RepID=A0A645F8T3_9ZZZZ